MQYMPPDSRIPYSSLLHWIQTGQLHYIKENENKFMDLEPDDA